MDVIGHHIFIGSSRVRRKQLADEFVDAPGDAGLGQSRSHQARAR